MNKTVKELRLECEKAKPAKTVYIAIHGAEIPVGHIEVNSAGELIITPAM